MNDIVKVEKKVSLATYDVYDFEGSLDDMISNLEGLKEDQYTRYVVEADTCYYDGDDGYANLEVYGYRMETDEELAIKIDSHNKAELAKYLREEKKIADEKQLLIELKAKYETA